MASPCRFAPRIRSRALNPRALFVVGEQVGDEATRAVNRERKPIAFQCIQCAAGLSVDGTKRTVECQYCQASNYLPDGLWRELNPVPVMSEYYLVCELTPEQRGKALAQEIVRGLKEKHWRPGKETDLDSREYGLLFLVGEEIDKRDVLQNPSTPAETLELAVKPFLENDARMETEFAELAAAHPNLPPQTLARLAAATEGTPLAEEVKRAVAQNPNTPAESLKLLAADSFDDETKRLAKEQIRARGGGGGRALLYVGIAVGAAALVAIGALVL